MYSTFVQLLEQRSFSWFGATVFKSNILLISELFRCALVYCIILYSTSWCYISKCIIIIDPVVERVISLNRTFPEFSSLFSYSSVYWHLLWFLKIETWIYCKLCVQYCTVVDVKRESVWDVDEELGAEVRGWWGWGWGWGEVNCESFYLDMVLIHYKSLFAWHQCFM